MISLLTSTMFKRLPVIILLPVFLSGCYAYKVFPKNYRDIKVPAAAETAYVVNPELKKEMKIFQYSGLYNISNDSNCHLKIRLHKIERGFTCGNGIVGWAILLGQLPVYMPDRYKYSFEEVRADESKQLSFELQVAQRYWFWDMFTFQKNFSKQAGKALSGNYRANHLAVNYLP